MPPPSSVASVRASCEVENLWTALPMIRQLEDCAIESRALSRLLKPGVEGGDRAQHADGQQQQVAAHEIRQRHDDPRGQRQLGVEAVVELRKRRHHLDRDDADQHDRQRDQDRRIDHRRDGLLPNGIDDLGVGDKASQHRVEVAGALARHQRRRIDAGKQLAVGLKRVGQRRAGAHFFVHIVQDGFEHRVRQARAQNVERLHERHAGLEQRRQLLVEHEELVPGDFRAPLTERNAAEAEAAARAQRENVQAFLLELAAKVRFALRDVDPLDDLAGHGAESAAKFHLKACPTGHYRPDYTG